MKIILDSEEEKQSLIDQSKYIHDFKIILRGKKGKSKFTLKGLDSDKANTLMHLYLNPELIEVKK